MTAVADLRARVTELLEHHQAGAVERLTPILERADKQIYRADLGDGRAVIVRVFPAGRPIARVRGDVAILAHAIARSILAERPIAALELDGRGVAVTECIAGNRPERTAADLRQLGELAGRLSALPPVTGDELLGRDAGSRPVDDLSHAREELTRLRGAVPPAARSQWAELEAAVAVAHDGSDLPHALIHPDCHLANSIRDPHGRVVLIDWEGAGVGPRLWPLGVLLFNAVLRCVDEPHVDPAACRIDLDLVAPIIEGFVRHGTVDARELERLGDLIRIRPLAIAVRRFARATEDGRLDQARGWWSHHAEADAVAARARAELVRVCRPPSMRSVAP